MKIRDDLSLLPNEFLYFAFKLALSPQRFWSSKIYALADFGKIIFPARNFCTILYPFEFWKRVNFLFKFYQNWKKRSKTDFWLVGNVKRATRVSSKLQAPVFLERPVRFFLFLKIFYIFRLNKIYFGYFGHEWKVSLTDISSNPWWELASGFWWQLWIKSRSSLAGNWKQ